MNSLVNKVYCERCGKLLIVEKMIGSEKILGQEIPVFETKTINNFKVIRFKKYCIACKA